MEACGETDVRMYKHLTLAWDADDWSATSSVRFIKWEEAHVTHWTGSYRYCRGCADWGIWSSSRVKVVLFLGGGVSKI
jgi:hypothetical protein